MLLSRTRHLKVWHDHADVASHGHFLVLVSAIFDPAIYYTTNEMKQKGVSIDVETEVERPHLYYLCTFFFNFGGPGIIS